MDKMDLKKYGITGVTEIVYNPSYDELFREETKKGLRGFEKGQLTETGAVNVMTGVYTGRSPKDKFFVMDETTKDTIWWTSDEYKNDNKPVTKAAWKELKKLATQELSGKKLYVVDTFCGANENSRLKIRFIMEVAWQAHFVKNMFIRPTDAELEKYGEPDFVVLNASKAKVKNYKKLGLNSETAVVFNLTEKMQVILNTWYGGEMKKGMFSYMNYLLPLKGMASMHCSANTNAKGETAIFFGLSGTGKTTLAKAVAGAGVVAASVCRLCPGVLSSPEGYEEESHYSGLLEYPQYSRPEEWNGRRVPEILLSGHHANIAKWRHEQALERTRTRRPDLYEKYEEKSMAKIDK